MLGSLGWLGFAILFVASLVTSTVSGALGMAGGIALLGVMTTLLPAADVVPLHGVVQLASNLTRTFAFRKLVNRRMFWAYAPLALVGTVLATLVRSKIELGWFEPVVGVFILAVLAWRRYAPKLRALPMWSYAPLGFVVGFLSIFLGATGPLLAPFFLRDDLDKEEVIATQAACQTWVHLLKIPAFLSLGFDYLPHLGLLAGLLLAVVIGTYVGKHMLERLSQATFVIIFQLVLIVMAVHLIVTGLYPLW
jgi:uncharacterized membrane protein YfcA